MKPLLLTILFAATSIFSAEPLTSKYPLVMEGRRVSFDEIQKSDLGKVMSFYLLPGRPKFEGGTGIMPDGARTLDKEKGIVVLTGELHAILKDGLRLRWYYDAKRTSSSEYGAISEDIDYIVIKE